jgi:hypothetical protein
MMKIMKKSTVILTFLVISCASGPKGEDTLTTPAQMNSALDKIYDTYRSGLILDNAQDYTVQQGDTLSKITKKFYGSVTNVGDAGPNNGYYFPIILMASDVSITDPDLIEPGMNLKLPDLAKNLANPSARNAIIDTLQDVAKVYAKKGDDRSIRQQKGLETLADSL